MPSTNAGNLAFELAKLLDSAHRFRDLRKQYSIVQSLRDHTARESSHYARRHRTVVRIGGTLNRSLIVLPERIRLCRQKVNGLATAPNTGESWRMEVYHRLGPALADLNDAIQRPLQVYPESGGGLTHAEILGALDRHEAEIRACGQFLSDVAEEVRKVAITNALNRYSTLLDALIYLGRRNDIRPTTTSERDGGNEHRTHVTGEPIAFALVWVHSRCTWESPRNGGELWDYVGQSARGDIVDAEVREVVVPQLRAIETPEMRRSLWSELLFRFPHIAVELAEETQSVAPRSEQLGEQVAHQLAGPHPGDELVRYLVEQPDEIAAVIDLPEHLRDPSVLTVTDADGLIEFGTRRHCFVGPDGPDQELRVETGWDFGSITGPKRIPMKQFIAEALAFTGDDRIRPHVRLTAEGRVRAARLVVGHPAPPTDDKPKTTETDWRDVQRRLLEMYERGDPYTTIADLALRMGCGKTTIHKAIDNSTKLKGWQVRHRKGKKTHRASSLTEVHLDNNAQTREQNPAEAVTRDDPEEVLAHLIQDAEPKVRATLNAISIEDLRNMSGDQVRELVDVIRNDPDKYNRLLGRKA